MSARVGTAGGRIVEGRIPAASPSQKDRKKLRISEPYTTAQETVGMKFKEFIYRQNLFYFP